MRSVYTLSFADGLFCGRHVLSGVWMTEYNDLQYRKAFGKDDIYSDAQAANVCLILLDGQVYRFIEDPDDGYRSMCHEPQLVTDVFPVNWWQTSERVQGFLVERAPSCWDWDKHTDTKWWLPDWNPDTDSDSSESSWVRTEECHLLVFVSEVTGKPVLVVGTSNTNDYYPSFVAHFRPENMSLNSERRDLIDIAGTAGAKEKDDDS